jgi:threonine synthase
MRYEEMNFVSTRGNGEPCNAAQAVIKGIASDRGLYVPERMPKLTHDPVRMKGLNYRQIAREILSTFFDDYSSEALQQCIENAYDEKFEAEEVVPVVKAGDAYFLELFHGPTAAFKDLALSILPHLMTSALKKEQESSRIVILTATSGDTGKAALEGFANVPDTEIIVFYPHVGVSQVQERQMTTQEGANTHVFGIRGNFDDAQSAVKKIFGDAELRETLLKKDCKFSSANSINIGRLVPQVVYYVWAYVRMLEEGTLKPGEKMNVVVPTGNFGNILAAYYAGQMGLPIGKLICASNRNKVLTDFLNSGIYDIRREFYITSSPSMDILVSSNLERLLYHLSGDDSGHVAALMKGLEEEKRYEAGAKIKSGLSDFYGGSATDDETSKTIRDMYNHHHYLMDPHTAVAYKVYADYRQSTGDMTPTVIAATASAYKFADVVAASIGLPEQTDGFAAIQVLHRETGVRIPAGLYGLEDKPVRHREVLDKEEIIQAVLDAL